jgi:hypothetical protein
MRTSVGKPLHTVDPRRRRRRRKRRRRRRRERCCYHLLSLVT